KLGGGPAATVVREGAGAAELAAGADPAAVAAAHPACLAAWASLADLAAARGEFVASYAYARTGYHRGLDQLRRAGWRGHGPVPGGDRPDRGVLPGLRRRGRARPAPRRGPR